jgi:hypothetical protein
MLCTAITCQSFQGAFGFLYDTLDTETLYQTTVYACDHGTKYSTHEHTIKLSVIRSCMFQDGCKHGGMILYRFMARNANTE